MNRKHRLKSERGQGVFEYALILMLVAVVLLVILAVLGLPRLECEAKTDQIGYPHRWSFMAGCEIQVGEGRWIPLDSYYYQERP